MTKDPRLHFDATTRNADPILEVLKPLIGTAPCHVLEIASGSGQHGVHITNACPNLTWWPSDPDPAHIESIDAWRANISSAAIQPARRIDVTDESWRQGHVIDGLPAEFDGIVNINMIHISPWPAATGLLEGAAKRIRIGGFLYIYGPFMRGGAHTAPSNQAFDDSLRRRNPDWRIRDVGDVEKAAKRQGLLLERIVEMPANNLSLIFGKPRP